MGGGLSHNTQLRQIREVSGKVTYKNNQKMQRNQLLRGKYGISKSQNSHIIGITRQWKKRNETI